MRPVKRALSRRMLLFWIVMIPTLSILMGIAYTPLIGLIVLAVGFGYLLLTMVAVQQTVRKQKRRTKSRRMR